MKKKPPSHMILDISENAPEDSEETMRALITEALVVLDEILKKAGCPAALAIFARGDNPPNSLIYAGSMTTEGVRLICEVIDARIEEYGTERRDKSGFN